MKLNSVNKFTWTFLTLITATILCALVLFILGAHGAGAFFQLPYWIEMPIVVFGTGLLVIGLSKLSWEKNIID